MKIHIQKSSVELNRALRAHIDDRLGFALGRFGEQIGRVLVRFSDAQSDGDGEHESDKRCQIDVALRPRSVHVEDADTDLLLALDRASGRASRLVARALEHQRAWDQVRPFGGPRP